MTDSRSCSYFAISFDSIWNPSGSIQNVGVCGVAESEDVEIV